MLEHVPDATAAGFARNLLFVGLGNLGGGGLLVGAAYALVGRGRPGEPACTTRPTGSTAITATSHLARGSDV